MFEIFHNKIFESNSNEDTLILTCPKLFSHEGILWLTQRSWCYLLNTALPDGLVHIITKPSNEDTVEAAQELQQMKCPQILLRTEHTALDYYPPIKTSPCIFGHPTDEPMTFLGCSPPHNQWQPKQAKSPQSSPTNRPLTFLRKTWVSPPPIWWLEVMFLSVPYCNWPLSHLSSYQPLHHLDT